MRNEGKLKLWHGHRHELDVVLRRTSIACRAHSTARGSSSAILVIFSGSDAPRAADMSSWSNGGCALAVAIITNIRMHRSQRSSILFACSAKDSESAVCGHF